MGPRRTFATCLLACALGIGALTPLTASAAAPTRGGLVGVFSLDTGLYRIDPSTGALTRAATLPPVDFIYDLAAEPRSTLIYGASFVCQIPGPRGCGGSLGELLTIDSGTGTVKVVSTTGFLQNLAYDPIDRTLYGLTLAACCPFSTTVVRVDTTTGRLTPIATVQGDPQSLAIDAPSHMLYVDVPNFDSSPYSGQLVSVDTRTGIVSALSSVGPALFRLGFDRRAHAIFAMTWDSPSRFVRVDPQSGVATDVGSFATSLGTPVALAIDPAAHTVFVVESEVFGNFTAINRVDSLDERTGAAALGQTFPGLTTAIAFQQRVPV